MVLFIVSMYFCVSVLLMIKDRNEFTQVMDDVMEECMKDSHITQCMTEATARRILTIVLLLIYPILSLYFFMKNSD